MENLFNNQVFYVGIYIRLSREDGDKLESESISNQRDLLTRFVRDNGYILIDEYIDDGYTGTNFDRPGFQKLLKDMESKKINMVITKDLSRLGRDYIQVGYYVEKYFPENRIRYISVLDNVDTYVESSNNDITPFKAVMNDMYAKDISKKIKSVINQKKKSGQFIGPFANFGYKLDATKKGQFIIVEEQAEIVRRIYRLFLDGYGTYQIADKLSKEHVPTPCKMMNLKSRIPSDVWSVTTIRSILQNRVYLGECIQCKVKKINYKSKKMIKNSSEHYIIVENHHQPIIDEMTFNLVQKIFTTSDTSRRKKEDVLFKGLLYCYHCKGKMQILKRQDKYKDKVTYRTYTNCYNSTKKKNNNQIDGPYEYKCSHQYNEYYSLENKLLTVIKKICVEYLNNGFTLNNLVDTTSSIINNRTEIENQLHNIDKQLNDIDKKMKLLYSDRLNGIILEEDYINFSSELKNKRQELYNLKEKQEIKLEEKSKKNKTTIECDYKNLIQSLTEKEDLEKEDLFKLINRIEMNKEKDIFIYFNFLENSNVKVNLNAVI